LRKLKQFKVSYIQWQRRRKLQPHEYPSAFWKKNLQLWKTAQPTTVLALLWR
jgi:hypothetical protein